MILLLSSTCLPHLSFTLGALGRMILHLSPTCLSHLDALGRMILHLSSTCLYTCLSLCVSWAASVYTCLPLVSHTCLPHLSPTLVSHSGCLGPLELHLSYAPKATRVGDKCGRQVGIKWETSANSCGPMHPEWETSVGDKCKNMRPKTPRLFYTCLPLVSHTCLPLWVSGSA